MNSNIQVITTLDESDALLKITAKKLLLSGEAMFASLNPTVPPGFVVQAPRDAASGLLMQFSKDTPKVHVAVDQRLFDLPKARVALAFDGYLSWGLRQDSKVPIILFGGGEASSGVNVEVMVFSKHQLIEMREKVLPSIGTIYFQDSLTAMLTELRLAYPTARFVQAAPLTNWDIADVEYINDKPLRRLTYKPLARTFSDLSNYVIPGVLALTGLLIYPALAMTGWATYNTSIANYEQAIADPAITSKDGMDTDFLTMMNARRIYMDTPRRQTALASKTAIIVTGIATIPSLQIIEMKLPAPGSNPQDQVGLTVGPNTNTQRAQINNDRPADIWLSVALPRNGEVAIDQAKIVMTDIANHTGLSLRLTHQGWRDDGKQRIFNIEGFIHD